MFLLFLFLFHVYQTVFLYLIFSLYSQTSAFQACWVLK